MVFFLGEAASREEARELIVGYRKADGEAHMRAVHERGE